MNAKNFFFPNPLRTALIMLFLLAAFFAYSPAQNSGSGAGLDKEKWKALKEGKKYFEKKEEMKQPQMPSFNMPFGISSQAVKISLFTIVTAGLLYFLFRLVKMNFFDFGAGKNGKTGFSFENLEENLLESDLDRFLKQALAQGAYRDAVRVYFLIVVKELQTAKFIKWKKDKTNAHFLTETRNQDFYKDFARITRSYERAWYGDKEVREEDYNFISPYFEQLVENIRQTASKTQNG